jgi:hypothetical protein
LTGSFLAKTLRDPSAHHHFLNRVLMALERFSMDLHWKAHRAESATAGMHNGQELERASDRPMIYGPWQSGTGESASTGRWASSEKTR